MPRNRLSPLAAALLPLALSGLPGHAGDYRLQPGDVLELSIAGRADIRETMPVNIDGEVIVPLAGALPAAGQTLDAISGEIRERIALIALPVLDEHGLTTAEHIHPSLVSVTLRGYRPVYVDGAVRRPGAHDFVPGLTARQAIALAGGTSPVEDAQDPALRMIELRSRIGDLAARARAAQARIDRLRAEVAGETIAPPASDTEEGAETLERLTGALRQESARADLAFLDAALVQADTERDALRRQLAAETEGAETDSHEFDRLAEAARAGTITAARLGEARRGLLYARSRQWETEARLAGVERDDRMLGNQRAQRLLRTREEAAEALGAELLALNGIRAELGAADRALSYLSDYASEHPGGPAPRIEIAGADGSNAAVPAGEDPKLHPGDLVHVSLDEVPRDAPRLDAPHLDQSRLDQSRAPAETNSQP